MLLMRVPEYTHIITESVAQRLESIQPLAFPFFAAIAPTSVPFTLAPWIPKLDKFLAAEFNGFEYSICMAYSGEIRTAIQTE
jgi:hypothetical protein